MQFEKTNVLREGKCSDINIRTISGVMETLCDFNSISSYSIPKAYWDAELSTEGGYSSGGRHLQFYRASRNN